MSKKITLPKEIYDRMKVSLNASETFHILDISRITSPYHGQLGRKDNKIFMYKDSEWLEVELPTWINPAGRYEFGNFITFYIYWIDYMHPENYHGLSYMLTTVPLVNMEEWTFPRPENDDKINDFVCNFATNVTHSGGTVRFVQNASEAAMQACILSEQYKYEIIESAVSQFKDVSCVFIPEGEENDEN